MQIRRTTSFVLLEMRGNLRMTSHALHAFRQVLDARTAKDDVVTCVRLRTIRWLGHSTLVWTRWRGVPLLRRTLLPAIRPQPPTQAVRLFFWEHLVATRTTTTRGKARASSRRPENRKRKRAPR